MKKTSHLLSTVLSISLCACVPLFVTPAMTTHAEPAYAKWGQMAMKETKKKYPKADIVDYKHVGRKELSPSAAQETFRLWLKEGKQRYEVIVRITFETRTEKVLSVRFQQEERTMNPIRQPAVPYPS
ncbi:YqzG/YhdC family protein [Brevibacillus migulae]|uniref:YqzG/YhdC family protein n=1 Tax=Brevibacillus migulae TaxID=1644114 RepID=UPI00106EB9B9|nr:YqzG/YhdC family protein [Brevibacillus migulae]